MLDIKKMLQVDLLLGKCLNVFVCKIMYNMFYYLDLLLGINSTSWSHKVSLKQHLTFVSSISLWLTVQASAVHSSWCRWYVVVSSVVSAISKIDNKQSVIRGDHIAMLSVPIYANCQYPDGVDGIPWPKPKLQLDLSRNSSDK